MFIRNIHIKKIETVKKLEENKWLITLKQSNYNFQFLWGDYRICIAI